MGKTPSGIREVEFEYRGGKKRFHGYLADDVAKVKPSAVVQLPSGHKAVNPRAIDAPFYMVGRDRRARRKSLGELLAE